MTFRCDNNACSDPFTFPKPIKNNPCLSTINYRIGRYSDFRKALFKKLDGENNLKKWTYRGSDDPGIALLEGVSILGDILCFYQDLYANEKFLRTAKWRESVASLVKLLGYRLSPGMASYATFAVQIKGAKSVIVPKGTQFKVQIENLTNQVEFETSFDTEIYPQLSKFKLFAPQKQIPSPPDIPLSEIEFYIFEGFDLKKGDRLMIGVAPDEGIDDPKNIDILNSAQIVIVDEIRISHGQQLFKIKGNIDNFDPKNSYICFKIGRSFSHFGHNAPRTLVNVNVDGKAQENLISYTRYISNQTDINVSGLFDEINNNSVIRVVDPSPLSEKEFPLDTIVNDIPSGNRLLIQGKFYGINIVNFPYPFPFPWPIQLSSQSKLFIREIKNIKTRSITWGSISGSTSLIEIESLENSIITEGGLPGEFHVVDIRDLQIHEVGSPQITLKASQIDQSGQGQKLIFYADESFDDIENVKKILKGSNIQLSVIEGTQQEIKITNISDAVDDKESIISNAIILTLDQTVDYSKFSNHVEKNKVDVYGNIIYATQGKTQNETILGNGDNNQKFQTFKIPKSPLTYLLLPDNTPSAVPAIEIYVNGAAWKRVDSFFDKGPKEQIYIIREDQNGDSWVQFGDGNTGLRLPSGISNVTCIWRTGNGANGSLKQGTTVQLTGKIEGFDKAQLLSDASGGAQQETGEHAKESASGKVQSLDRIVSLKDYETETLTIPGVRKVSARWDLVNGYSPGIILTVLTDDGQNQNFNQIRNIIYNSDNNRGARNCPITVTAGQFQDVSLQISYSMDPSFRQEIVEDSIRNALGAIQNQGNNDIQNNSNNKVNLNGLFGLDQRQFGQSEYTTRIQGIVQQVQGVIWVDVIYVFNTNNRRKNIFIPNTAGSYIIYNTKIFCKNDHILRLKTENLQLIRNM